MSAMPEAKKPATVVEVGPLKVSIYEWTMEDIRAYLVADKTFEFDVVDAMLIEGWNLQEVALFTDVTAADLAPLRPSEIRKLLGAIERVNVDFFAMCGHVDKLGSALMPALSLSETSPA